MAADKKHSARFCLQFDPDDAQQQQVIHMLNSLGRGEKSAFIAKAILHYINCSETPKLELLFPPPDDTVYVITQSQLDNLSPFRRSTAMVSCCACIRISSASCSAAFASPSKRS